MKVISVFKENQVNVAGLLILAIEERKNKKDEPYLQFTLTDGDDTIVARQWSSTLDKCPVKNGEVARFTINFDYFNGAPNYQIQKIQWLDQATIDVTPYVKHSPIDPTVMWVDIMSEIERFKDAELAALTKAILEDNKEEYLRHGAASSHHHNFLGGLIYHSYRMMKAGLALCAVYPGINKDLIVAGTVLHDIGKLKEMNTDTFGNSEYTMDGNLFGHLLIGYELISRYADKFKLDEAVLKNLLHIIVSHHGQIEWGAIKEPSSIEAMLVHELDMIDSRAMTFEDAYRNMESGTMNMSGKINGIFPFKS